MRSDASLELACLSVDRRFDPQRLARDCQARAYEQIVPVAGRAALARRQADDAPADGGPAADERIEIQSFIEIQSLTSEGVAA
jgi:hypothetical protein